MMNDNNDRVLGEFINYCYSEAKGDYGYFAIMMYYGMTNKETGEKTMNRLKELADSLLENKKSK